MQSKLSSTFRLTTHKHMHTHASKEAVTAVATLLALKQQERTVHFPVVLKTTAGFDTKKCLLLLESHKSTLSGTEPVDSTNINKPPKQY